MLLRKVFCIVLSVFILMTPMGVYAFNNTDDTNDYSSSATMDASNFRTAISVSPFTESIFSQGVVFQDGLGNTAGNTAELQALYARHGASEVYARIATDRYNGLADGSDHSLKNGLERARLAKSLGLPFNPEIGCFSHYGDVMDQPAPDFSEYPEITIPGSWETLTLDQMCAVLRQYGALIAREILNTGVTVNVWNIGNEVNFGFAGVAAGHTADAVDAQLKNMSVIGLMILGDLGICWLKDHVWKNQAKLMNAVKEGILSVDSDAKFSTHVSTFFPISNNFSQSFYQTMKDNGFTVDVAGLSFYPSNAGLPVDRLQALKNTVTDIHENLGVPVFLAEYSYPAKWISSGKYNMWNYITPGYPLSEEGQAALLKDLTVWGKTNGVCGIRPWAPELVNADWKDLSFFNLSGNIATARPVLYSKRDF